MCSLPVVKAQELGERFLDTSGIPGFLYWRKFCAASPDLEENKAAWEVLRRFDKPFMLAFADKDPVTAGGDKKFLAEVPGCQGVAHRTIENAGHFLQQEQPAQCVQAILDVTGPNLFGR